MDLAQFASKMRLRAQNLPANVNKVKQNVTVAVLTSLAQDTPVDTGAAVSNWVVSLDASAGARIVPHAPGHKGSTRTENSRATITLGTSVINQSIPGQVIHVANAVSYILDLNNGSSRQAPAGFVDSSILRGKDVLKKSKVILD